MTPYLAGALYLIMLWGLFRIAVLRCQHRQKRTARLVQKMPPREFERAVAQAFRRRGYRVLFTSQTRDGGIDLKLYQGDKMTGVVECKRWSAAVGPAVVRAFYGALSRLDGEVAGYLVAPRFSSQAHEEAEDLGIILLDAVALLSDCSPWDNLPLPGWRRLTWASRWAALVAGYFAVLGMLKLL